MNDQLKQIILNALVNEGLEVDSGGEDTLIVYDEASNTSFGINITSF